MKNKLKKAIFLLNFILMVSLPVLSGDENEEIDGSCCVCRCHSSTNSCLVGNKISFRPRCNCVTC
ncbi:hypothetical protein SAMN04488541_1015111 [Thermoflexibacter ruber]|uniref:Uncharacterized protein n=1 Tax=Thermoflexibacter ruber TaxID=1003 RepID=A0A1I2FYY3_9BACT|nr:hypothetical protein SAMN04488541_1015111 [Thermoflexibacter ruber]